MSTMKTNFLKSTEALRNELIATNESLSEKENTIANLMLKCDENCVENKKNEKKQNKCVKKQSKPSILQKKNKPLDETITRMKIDKDKETKLEEANQNDYKVDSNVPVSNRFSILDRDQQDDCSVPKNVSSDNLKLSPNTSKQFSPSTITSSTASLSSSILEVTSGSVTDTVKGIHEQDIVSTDTSGENVTYNSQLNSLIRTLISYYWCPGQR